WEASNLLQAKAWFVGLGRDERLRSLDVAPDASLRQDVASAPAPAGRSAARCDRAAQAVHAIVARWAQCAERLRHVAGRAQGCRSCGVLLCQANRLDRQRASGELRPRVAVEPLGAVPFVDPQGLASRGRLEPRAGD